MRMRSKNMAKDAEKNAHRRRQRFAGSGTTVTVASISRYKRIYLLTYLLTVGARVPVATSYSAAAEHCGWSVVSVTVRRTAVRVSAMSQLAAHVACRLPTGP